MERIELWKKEKLMADTGKSVKPLEPEINWPAGKKVKRVVESDSEEEAIYSEYTSEMSSRW